MALGLGHYSLMIENMVCATGSAVLTVRTENVLNWVSKLMKNNQDDERRSVCLSGLTDSGSKRNG